MPDKTDLRGRPKSAESMRQESLRAGRFKGEVFITEVQKVAGPKLRLALLRKSQREGWVKGSELARVIDMISALEIGESLPEPRQSTGSRGVQIAPRNPGAQKAYDGFLARGGRGTFEQFCAAMSKVTEPRETKAIKPWVQEPKIEPVKAPPAPAATAAEIEAAHVAASACLDVTAFRKYVQWATSVFQTQADGFFYRLPDGKLIDWQRADKKNSDPWVLSVTPIIAVKAAPSEMTNPVLADVGGILKWTERAPTVKVEPPVQGLQLWNATPLPEPEPDRHRPDPNIIPGGLNFDGVLVMPRKKNA